MGRKPNLHPYGDEQLTLKELLEKPEILRYLGQNGMELNREALRRKLSRWLCKGIITKENVTMQLPRKETRGGGNYRKYYPYGDEQLTLKELLEKPEILRYLRRNGMEKKRKNLEDKLYNALRDGRFTKEIVEGYMLNPEPVKRVKLRKPKEPPLKPKELPLKPKELPLKPKESPFKSSLRQIYGLTDGIYGMRRVKLRKPREKYIPIDPSEVPLLDVRKERNREFKSIILGLLGEN